MTTSPTETVISPRKLSFELRHLGKQYRHRSGSKEQERRSSWAIQGVSYSGDQSRILGVIGRNGAGKTTLLNCIAGVVVPTEGEVSFAGRILGLFQLGIGFQDELTGRENIFLNGAILGASRAALLEREREIVEFSELGTFMDQPLGSYSQGMRLRLAFSIASHLDFDLLVIDEVLAVGDVRFQEKCIDKLISLKEAGKALVFTSQDLLLVCRLADEVILLDHGKVKFSGSPREAVDRFQALLAAESFSVAPFDPEARIESTKRWANSMETWGRRTGSGEIKIDFIAIRDRWGRCPRFYRSGAPLKIEVAFKAKRRISNPHFGIAIFREDGVYCYGTNTREDAVRIAEVREGKSSFTLEFHNFRLAPGVYRLSVAIWDAREEVPFDYHEACYALVVKKPYSEAPSLLKLNPIVTGASIGGLPPGALESFLDDGARRQAQDTLLCFDDSYNDEMSWFKTNETVSFLITPIKKGGRKLQEGLFTLWRDDGILCEAFLLHRFREKCRFLLPLCPLLPGKYEARFDGKFQRGSSDAPMTSCKLSFGMYFNRGDHGTVFLEHHWRFSRRIVTTMSI